MTKRKFVYINAFTASLALITGISSLGAGNEKFAALNGVMVILAGALAIFGCFKVINGLESRVEHVERERDEALERLNRVLEEDEEDAAPTRETSPKFVIDPPLPPAETDLPFVQYLRSRGAFLPEDA